MSTWQQQSHGRSQMSTMNFLWLTKVIIQLYLQHWLNMNWFWAHIFNMTQILSVYPNELYHLGWQLKISIWNVIEIFINPPFSTMRWLFHPFSANQIAAIFTIVVRTMSSLAKVDKLPRHITILSCYNIITSQYHKIIYYNIYHCCPDNVEFRKSWQLGSPRDCGSVLLDFCNIRSTFIKFTHNNLSLSMYLVEFFCSTSFFLEFDSLFLGYFAV